MELQPKRQPGRADRKAAAYAVEIVRLRRAGYTYEAIREAMADAGIELSTSALRREVRRYRSRSDAVTSGSPSSLHPVESESVATPPSGSSPLAPVPATPVDSHGHDIAEAFFKANPSHPLVHTKEIP